MDELRDIPPIRWLLPISLIVPVCVGTIAWLNGFDGLYGQDAFAYYDYGVNALREQFYPPLPFFWPPGYPLVIFLTSFVVGASPLAGQLVSLLCGGLVVLATGLLTYEVWRGEHRLAASLLAASVMAVAGQVWQSSAVVMADTLALATATMGVWALARYARLLERRSDVSFWLAVAAGLVGYATITRWIYGTVAIVCTMYALWLFWQHRVVALRHGMIAAVVALAVLVPVLLPSLTGGETFGGNFQLQFKNWHPEYAFQHEFENADGRFSFAEVNALYYGRLLSTPFYFTPVLALFTLPGLLSVRRRSFLPVVGWLLIVFGLLVGVPQQNIRFGLSYAPPVAVLCGVGMVSMWMWLWRFRRLQWVLVPVVAWGMVWAVLSGIDLTQSFIARQQHDMATVRWVESRVPANAQIITFGLTLSIDHYTDIEPHEIYYLSVGDVETIVSNGEPTYLLLDVYNVEQQWPGKSPHTNYHALLDGPGLTERGQYRAFTLFEVNYE